MLYLFLGVDLLFELCRGNALGEIIVRGGIGVNIKRSSEAFSSLLFGGNRKLVLLFLESVDAFEIILVFTPAHGGRTVGRLSRLQYKTIQKLRETMLPNESSKTPWQARTNPQRTKPELRSHS